jgi:ATP-dependent Clp protease ATP-binding subunit ClpB
VIRENFERITEKNQEEVVENTKNLLFEMLKQTVRPEFLNRIDEVIMFQPLTAKNIRSIIRLQINQLQEVLKQQEITLDVTPEALDWLAEEGYNPEFGARPLKRVVQKKVLNELSKQMLLGKVQARSHVILDVFDGVVVFRQPEEVEIEQEELEG